VLLVDFLRFLYSGVCKAPVGYFCTISLTGPLHEKPEEQEVFVTGGTSLDIRASNGDVLTLTFKEA
jgi:hypothetical protein